MEVIKFIIIYIVVISFTFSCTNGSVRDKVCRIQITGFGKTSDRENEFIEGEWTLRKIILRKKLISNKCVFEDEKEVDKSLNIKISNIGIEENNLLIAYRKPDNNRIFIFNRLDTLNGEYYLRRINFSREKYFALKSMQYQYYKNDSIEGYLSVELLFFRDKVPDKIKKYIEKETTINTLLKKQDTIDFDK
ncbi:hypothetical protein [Apibacter adventoris]|uniref:hypothetical protein n=1 Tax=Apibacter adventoris TaxID=1679466 RepID=UPI0011B0AEB9|nr:hypothetical protein [Apibacter adventoris]